MDVRYGAVRKRGFVEMQWVEWRGNDLEVLGGWNRKGVCNN